MQGCFVCPVPSCRSRFLGVPVFGISVSIGSGIPVFRHSVVSVFRFSGIMFGQDQLEPVHLVAELANLAFLSGDEGADCRRVVRWQVTVGEQFRGVPVVLPDDALVAVHGDGQAAEEGARVPEPLRRDRAAEARPRRLRVVVRQPAAPFHPRIPESEGIHRTGTHPLRNRPTHRCQFILDMPDGTR